MEALQSLAFLNWPVVLGVIALFVVLRVRGARTFTWTLACWLGIFAFVRFGFATPIPFPWSRSTWASRRSRSWPT